MPASGLAGVITGGPICSGGHNHAKLANGINPQLSCEDFYGLADFQEPVTQSGETICYSGRQPQCLANNVMRPSTP